MKYDKLNKFGSSIHLFEYDPLKNPSQIVKSGSKRQRLEHFKHEWFMERGYKQVCVINWGFFHMSDPASTHIGLLARDHGFIEGYPTSAFEVWLGTDGKLRVEQIRNRNDIQGKFVWGSTLAYSLILDGKRSLQGVGGFNVSSKVARTAIGQKYDGTIVLLVADALTGRETADILLDLKCEQAIMADGGGSSGMLINGAWKKRTTRALGTALVVFAKENVIESSPSPHAPSSRPTLRRGAKGEHVSYLQTLLQQLGFYTMNIDGIFGPGTERAVTSFQGKYYLVIDGIVGQATWGKLKQVAKQAANLSNEN